MGEGRGTKVAITIVMREGVVTICYEGGGVGVGLLLYIMKEGEQG